MPLAAVRPVSEPGTGAMLVSCEGFSLSPNSIVEVSLEGRVVTCSVVAAPEQMIAAHGTPVGQVAAVHSPEPVDLAELATFALSGHPAAAFPFFGQAVRTANVAGTVVGLDIPGGTIRIQLSNGETQQVALSHLVVDS